MGCALDWYELYEAWGTVRFLGRMFKIKCPQLIDLVEKFIRLAADVSYKTLVLGAWAA